MKRRWLQLAALALTWCAMASTRGAPGQVLQADAARGVTWQTSKSAACIGTDGLHAEIRVRFGSGGEQVLGQPAAAFASPTNLVFRYEVPSPTGGHLLLERQISLVHDTAGGGLRETFKLNATPPCTNDLELTVPFALQPILRDITQPDDSLPREPARAVLPLKNGWAKPVVLLPSATTAEYRLGAPLTGKETPELALPLVHLQAGDVRAAVMADPYFGALLTVRQQDHALVGAIRWRYAGSQVPIHDPQTREFAIWIPTHQAAEGGLTNSLDAFFRLMLPDVPPGPRWLHDIAMVGYDFLSDNGEGWERDVHLLASWLRPVERRRVALCLHGWYDALGSYCFDAARDTMQEEWTAFARTRKVHFTSAELKRRLRVARDEGFRVLLYFADGLAADSGVPGYRDDWAYRDAAGHKIEGWQGPDTFGKTYLRNAAHPEVSAWYLRYLDALLRAYGAEIDGVVWDETFHTRTGQIAFQPMPAYCDQAMLKLVKALTQKVRAFNPAKVFLASDCLGPADWQKVPGYAMVASGTYQDTHCDPPAWSYGLFPNWRNTLWSCNWDDVTGFHFTRWGVERFGAPVAISNGWGDDCGPSEWQPWQRDAILRLFRERLHQKPRPRLLATDPATSLQTAPDHPAPSDTIPDPAPGERNWAAAANGARVSASSCEISSRGAWKPEGAIDGRRDTGNWSTGHGWASKAGEGLPQWLQVDFGRPRTVKRFVVVTFQNEGTAETAAKWGVRDYTIEVWDATKARWRPAVVEKTGRLLKVRVHPLARPLRTERCRVMVTGVAPLDGQARLLQFEAWGTEEE